MMNISGRMERGENTFLQKKCNLPKTSNFIHIMRVKTLLASLFILLNFGSLQAQVRTKLDLRLWIQLNEEKVPEQNISLLVKGDMNKVKALAEHFKGTYKYGYNNISSVDLPAKNVLAFSKSEWIEKIEGTGGKGVALMDTARIRNNIDSAQAGFAPLLRDLKGRNVVIGIIDGGIYWQHEDFKKLN